MNYYRNATFITSAASEKDFIKADKPVIAVCGKSNVGKSSFINFLADNKKLAKTSDTPGRTRLINYFDFDKFIIADLPGYGYAKVSRSEKLKWSELLDKFFEQKENIKHLILLVDIRHNPTEDDLLMLKYLNYHIIPFSVIATKSDKISKGQIKQRIRETAAFLKLGEQNLIAVSSVKKTGIEEVVNKINQVTSNK